MSADEQETAQEIAERSVDPMWASDAVGAALGMRVLEVGPGRAGVAMTVREDMVNGWGMAHGGLVASLADSAFAAACNSRGTVTVAVGFDMTFLESPRAGDELVATAEERALRGRSGRYDVSVRCQDGTVVAELRGPGRSTGRAIGA